jgi:predicted small lipoprotein YifL
MKAICLSFVILLALTACERKGPAEKAGEAIDRTVERAGDKIENATDRK